MKETETITIIDLDHQGRGIGKINNQVVFIPNALIGEIVKIQITISKKNYKEGKIIEYLKTSKTRVNPICPHFDRCGGCDIMHMSYKEQLSFKENKVRNIVKKYAGIEVVESIVPSDHYLGYRNKVTFQVNNSNIGFYAKKSERIIPIQTCYLIDEKMNELFSKIKEKITLKNIRQVVIRHSKKTDEQLVIIDTTGPISIKELKEFGEENQLSIHLSGFQDKIICGKDKLQETIGDYTFFISPDAFFQVNTEQTKKLYDVVKEELQLKGTEKILDLYCGTGTIGLYVSKESKELVGIEKNKNAISDALENKRINKVSNAEFMALDVDDFMKKLSYKPDVVIVDPPRSGLGIGNSEKMIDYHIQRIVYVSCDPLTLARDLQILKEFYEIEKIIPVDMFPNTNHVECVSVLNRR